MKDTFNNIISWVLAILMFIFGFNKFFGFIPVGPTTDPTAQNFMGAMFTSYLFVVVAMAEIVGGILLLIPRTRLLGWFLLLPVIFNIITFHIAHDFIGNGIWLLPTALFAFITFFNLTNSKKFCSMNKFSIF